MPQGTRDSILEQWNMRYMVVVEHGPASVGVYVPDLPDCLAAGESASEALESIREAVELHLDALREQGLQTPASSTFIDVAA
ncbi:MAG TPA: type II toxin-antitoxin system HicB family antitoxin [Rudaea sp.]|nr:type II toxin-antitoxin system HicB family antitoxin [Rudaea sp.]